MKTCLTEILPTTPVFATKHQEIYKHRWKCTLLVPYLVGGIPSNKKVAEGWIKKNLGLDNDDLMDEMVTKTMIDRGVPKEEAIDEVVATMKVNGFYRDPEHGLWFAGRNVKAALKEASNIRWPKRRWGPTNKGTRSFWAEHVFVPEERIYLGVMPTSDPVDPVPPIHQRFVSTWRGTGIQYEEYVLDARLTFTVTSDFGPDVISDDDWETVWVTGQEQGIGSSRGVGYGRYSVVEWTPISA